MNEVTDNRELRDVKWSQFMIDEYSFKDLGDYKELLLEVATESRKLLESEIDLSNIVTSYYTVLFKTNTISYGIMFYLILGRIVLNILVLFYFSPLIKNN
ncbi:hypothetical protein [Sediminibacillus albus]|uniref:hypothetical protein n=1 Tax=Sediminibacillus albus TaxID=407036 RepID=UPI0011144A71|nr:hypothetical protein [Sediminibacillus albus]